MAVTDAGAFCSHVPDLCLKSHLYLLEFSFIFHSCSHCWVKSLFLQEELSHRFNVFSVNETCARLRFIMFHLYSVAEFWHPTASPKVRLDLLSNQDIPEGGKNHADRNASGRLISFQVISIIIGTI